MQSTESWVDRNAVHIVFAGTALLSHTSGRDDGNEESFVRASMGEHRTKPQRTGTASADPDVGLSDLRGSIGPDGPQSGRLRRRLFGDEQSGISSNEPHSHGSAGLASIPVPPSEGATGYVLRTGFRTKQGSLLRSILFSVS